jgi:CheY-like chemotaxis protein
MPKTKPRKSAAKRSRGAKQTARRRRAVSPRAIEATLAELAHDIRTALTGILSLSELLATSGLGKRERDWAVSIKSTAEHLAMLTSLIVDAARADANSLVLRRDLIRPRRFAEAVAASLAARAEAKGLKAESTIAGDLPEAAIGDALRLRAALENLIDNAVKFTDRGIVAFTVASEPAGRNRVRLYFTITDSGIGLSAAEVKRLFRPFAQANRGIAHRYGGAGLGLALARRIARAMKGDLTVASKPGDGSQFQFSVIVDQVAEAPASGEEAGAASARPGVPPPLNVLCAEDNPYGRVVLNTILTELGHRADFVASGEAAVDAVARGRYDAVLMDVTLPGMDGLEATRRIRALGASAGLTPVVGISGRSNAADEAAALAAGMNGYLAKPLSPSALSAALAAVVG